MSILSQQLGRDALGQAVARCQAGDREAFNWIVDEYGGLLFGSAVLMTRDRLLAEDLVQETLLSAWKGISSFKRDRPFKPWIMRILVNHVRMHLRNRREYTGDRILSQKREIDAQANTEREVENRMILSNALAAISHDQREAIVLRYFADLTIPEIARSTRSRQGTVKSRIHRGLERMAKVMEEEDE